MVHDHLVAFFLFSFKKTLISSTNFSFFVVLFYFLDADEYLGLFIYGKNNCKKIIKRHKNAASIFYNDFHNS